MTDGTISKADLLARMELYISKLGQIHRSDDIIAGLGDELFSSCKKYQVFLDNVDDLRGQILKWLLSKTISKLLPKSFIILCNSEKFTKKTLYEDVSKITLQELYSNSHNQSDVFDNIFVMSPPNKRFLKTHQQPVKLMKTPKKRKRSEEEENMDEFDDENVTEERTCPSELNAQDADLWYKLKCAEDFLKMRRREYNKAQMYAGRVIESAFKIKALYKSIVLPYVTRKLQANRHLFDGQPQALLDTMVAEINIEATKNGKISKETLKRWNDCLGSENIQNLIVDAIDEFNTDKNIVKTILSATAETSNQNASDTIDEIDNQDCSDDDEGSSDDGLGSESYGLEDIMEDHERRLNEEQQERATGSGESMSTKLSYFYLIRPIRRNFVKIGVTNSTTLETATSDLAKRYRTYYGPIEDDMKFFSVLEITDAELCGDNRVKVEIMFILLVSI